MMAVALRRRFLPSRLDLPTTTIIVSGILIAGSAIGFLRDLVIARLFGASSQTDAFVVAWTIPETATPLLMEGALALFLVPAIARLASDRKSVADYVGRALPTLVSCLVLISTVLAVGAPAFVHLLAPGLRDPSAGIACFRIAAVTVLFLGLAGVAMSVLRGRGRFIVPATVYLAWNTGIVVCVFLLHRRIGVVSAAVGLAVGSLLMVAVQVPSLLRQVGRIRLSRSMSFRYLPLLALLPAITYSLGRQAQVYVERFLGSSINVGAISRLNYASKVGQMGMLLATTVVTIAFPALSRAASSGDRDTLTREIGRQFRIALLLIVPMTAFLVAYSYPLIELLFHRGAFHHSDVTATAQVLRVYCLGLTGQTMVNVSVVVCFSMSRRSPWPPGAALFALAVTTAADVILVGRFHTAGLAAGNAIGITTMALVLIWVIHRHLVRVPVVSLAGHLILYTAAAVIATVAAVGVREVVHGSPLVQLAMGATVVLPLYIAIVAAAHTVLRRLQSGRRMHRTMETAPLRQPPVLMCHAVVARTYRPRGVCLSTARFAQQLDWLEQSGLRGVSMRTLIDAWRAGDAHGLVGMTFDDGYDDFASTVVPLLLARGFTATVFPVANLVGARSSWDGEAALPLMNADELRYVAGSGMEIGSHGLTHRRLTHLSRDALERELMLSRSALEELVGAPVSGFCYPFGAVNREVIASARRAGYVYACATRTWVRPSVHSIRRWNLGELDTPWRLRTKLLLRPYPAFDALRVAR
jgi:putative peptidoglycan lipid II flippase